MLRIVLARATAVLLLLLGAALTIGGARLALLGGSWAYLLLGLAHLVAGVLVWRRHPAALALYAAVVLATLAWAVAEAGLDWWPLAARGDLVFMLAAALLVLWLIRGFAPESASSLRRGGGIALAASLALAAVAGLAALAKDKHDTQGRLAAAPGASAANYAGVADDDWAAYGRSNFGDRYSPLTQVTAANVEHLKRAWTFRTGDIRGPHDPQETTYELTPIKVGDTVYICTPHDWAIALDPDTGRAKWKFDPHIAEAKNLQHLTCRGVSYHAASAGGPAPPECPERIFLPTADARLFALDARTGRPCPHFGQGGAVDLWAGMPKRQTGFYYSTSPPLVSRGLVIVGGEVTDNYSTREPSGVIRAYDVNTGRLVWNWDAGNPDQTAPLGPGQHYTRNSPNSWTTFSADEALGLVYIPTGNQTPDQFGGYRQPTPERFNSAIVALDIATGRLRWVYQTVHHDLWDMDIGGQPSLIDLRTAQGVVPALVASTKRGDLYVLDRRTGAPLVPAPEKPVPQGAAPGDRTSPTQPFSALTFLPKRPLAERDMWGATLLDQMLCRIRFKSMRYEGIFTPPSVQGSIVYPGNFGVFDWGGIAVDPVRQIAFTNPDFFAFTSRLIPRERLAAEGKHESVQEPSGGADVQGTSQEGGANPQYGAPYAVDLQAFRSPLGLPCQAPPWGYVAGVDLRGGKIAWMHRNGTVRDNTPVPLPFKMGVPSLGGPIVTAGGVGFLTGTLDQYIRAYDLTDGRQLWQARLPAGAQATPMTYRSAASGRQYVLAVAGGHGSLGTQPGDYVIAYALPVR